MTAEEQILTACPKNVLMRSAEIATLSKLPRYDTIIALNDLQGPEPWKQRGSMKAELVTGALPTINSSRGIPNDVRWRLL